MSITTSISRIAEYYRRHGLTATLRRTGVAAKRAIFAGRMVVFYCDLSGRQLPPVNIPSTLKVERLRTSAELSAEHLQEMTSFWNPKQASRNIRERFEKGASLWLLECKGCLAGYGWTLQGGTMEPYYFPLGPEDVHFFDFQVFSEFRGRGFNPLLVDCILEDLANHCGGRAFIEAAEWNEAQLSSLRKTPFRLLGFAKSYKISGRLLTCWAGTETANHEQGDPVRGNGAVKMSRING